MTISTSAPSPEPDVASLSHKVHGVRRASGHVAGALSRRAAVGVAVVDELDFFRLARWKKGADGKNIEDLRFQDEMHASAENDENLASLARLRTSAAKPRATREPFKVL